MKEQVYSFDIFDTLITRKVAEPNAIFLLVQDKIKSFNITPFVKNNFARLRQEVEQYCQKRELTLYNKFDCNIDEIYNVLKQNYQIHKNVINEIKQIEIQEEIDNVVPINKNIKKLKELISEGKKIILISDMYLGADILRKILVNVDNIFNEIEIFCSADSGKRKSNGSIFRLIQKQYKIVEHVGDNDFADITQAKWNRIKPIKFYPEMLKQYEKNLLKKYPRNIYIQKSIGISKVLRQSSDNKVFNFALSYAAPIIYSYVNWLLKETLRRDIKSLYFVARDGFVLKIIADIIIKEKGYNIKTHYFYSSRRASRIADENNIEQYINQIFSELTKLQTEEFIANRFDISKKELIFWGGLNKEKLLKNQEFKNLIINKHKVKKELFLKYIKQEIDFNEKFGFVDLNGSGRTQDSLANLINKEIGKYYINSFYFNLQEDMCYAENSIKSAYINSVNLNSLFLELLCRTLHGQTLGYKEENGVISPILEYDNNSNMEKWGFNIYIEGVKVYTRMMSKENIDDDVTLCFEYLNYLKGLIDKETADIIGSIPFALYGNEKKVKEYIPAYNLFNIFKKYDFPHIASSRANVFIKYLSCIISKITDKKTYGLISKKRELAYIKICGHNINVMNIFK